MKIIQFYIFFGILMSCESRKTISVTVDSKNSPIDSLYVIESINESILSLIPVNDKKGKRIYFEIEYPTTGSIRTKDGKYSYLTLLYENKEMDIIIASDSSIRTLNLGDSLLNYLSTSNNEFIALNSNYIFTSNRPDSIVSLFQNFEALRQIEIEKRSSRLSPEEKELLMYQNSARIHSFLFYLGRLAMKLPADHEYFSFIKDLDNNAIGAKTLPQNLLYKHEINYLLAHDSIEDINLFIDYIVSQTENKDLSDFLTASYIAEIITSPSYWGKHEVHLNSKILKEVIAREKSNKYYDLIAKPSDSFFSSQKGVKAYNFEAEKKDGTKVKLSDYKGKIIFIDSWASWCGPCIAHRPKVLELEEKYSESNKVEILMISMDAEKSDWISYLSKKNQLNNKGDLIIENGMHTAFGDRFNVKQLPKYILIDNQGVIINSNISEPSVAVEETIEYELTKM